MTNEELINEFKRWLNAGRPAVYIRSISHFKEDTWEFTYIPKWASNTYYIVDDEQATFRKLQIDKPDTKFQVKRSKQDVWKACDKPSWYKGVEYRVKRTEWYEDPNMNGRPVWCKNCKDNEWEIDIFLSYHKNDKLPFNCLNDCWKYAEPVKLEDLHQGEQNDIN